MSRRAPMLALALAAPSLGQVAPWTTVEQVELGPSGGVDFGEFGVELDVYGETLLVGSRGNSVGSIHLFERSGSAWFEGPRLKPASENTSGSCGMSADTIVMGAYANSLAGFQSGAAYVFERSAGSWTETARLLAPAPLAEDRFGYAVAIDTDTIVVGAPRSLTQQPGRAHVFERSGGTWTLTADLSAPQAARADEFGIHVAIDGDTIAVAAWEEDSNRGACYVFRRTGGAWGLEARLVGSDSVVNDLFGWAIALDGGTLAVGALGHGGGRGAVYVFGRSAGTWSETAKLQQYENGPGDFLGRDVALRGDRLLVGTINDTEGRAISGAGHLFVRESSTWSHTGRYVPSDPARQSWFGNRVALGEDFAVVTAFRDDSPASGPRGAYVFHALDGEVENFCAAHPASTGVAARIAFNGSTSLSAGDMTLHAIGPPEGTFALFVHGAAPAGLPLGAGWLCVSPFAPGLGRLGPALPTDGQGTAVRVLGPTDLPPSILVGDTLYFQCIFRDRVGGSAVIQLSDGMRVTVTS